MSLRGNCVPLLGSVFLVDLPRQGPWLDVAAAEFDVFMSSCFLLVGGESFSETRQFSNLVG